ncbi:hypothetical protein [Methylorubrum populi]|nr:hypothetical protein [Methylorubrum populi]
MLRGVRISMWDGRKHDRAISDEVNRAKGAAADAGRFNKALVPAEALKPVQAAAGRVRAVHARYTLPWTDNGLDILPAAAVVDYDREMRAARAEFEAAADVFCNMVFPGLLLSAPARLGDMFRASDYPDASEIRDRFSMRVRTLNMPDARDFRVDMSDAQARAIRAELEAESRAALAEAMESAWQRVADVCGRMVERLNAYKPATMKGEKSEGVFRDSLVENVRDLVAVLPAFNLTNDPTLADVSERMRAELCKADAAELRDDVALRERTAAAAAEIHAIASDFLA